MKLVGSNSGMALIDADGYNNRVNMNGNGIHHDSNNDDKVSI